ncbi:MAG TPA: Xaa-Pro peptidase family protein [Candidatus Sumerlaeota bacterium]|nr:MAG: putative peptidase [candidate division BRC1 bacterium ADurb.Bin183]HOE63905.1 Xaa-Pro peptidase family protein [Candidatus Sumerlaeota bacterium]HRR31647.1 Xaa-Pro peptidase family protein [Candidatus Sumerlaeia bacterium]HON51191.1 Xaa-Pro peptidase family protein [Candidatus Sumerlaeota bacterium]HOR64492.1 Xaa-Pro peptidase family protein [Candidatus Sumerlaeota bacterium]
MYRFHEIRIHRLYSRLAELGLDGMIVLDRENTFYLTNFSGTASILLLMQDSLIFLADSRYYERAKKNFRRSKSPSKKPINIEVVQQQGDGREQLKAFFDVRGKLRIGFESSISYESFCWLEKVVRPARLVEVSKEIADLRAVKDSYEQMQIRRAAALTDLCVDMLASNLRPGVSEREVAIAIRRFWEDAGAEGESFDPIIAFGANAAIPHHKTSNHRLKSKDVALIDFGCRVNGYCSDLTRTFFIGDPNANKKNIYKIVHDAQAAALQKVKPGVPAAEIDTAARDLIARAGFGDFFSHRTGHGVGIAIHEKPSIGAPSSDILLEGMVITVEPGIYLPGKFGVRIEDLVLVTKNGAELLSKTPKDIKIL